MSKAVIFDLDGTLIDSAPDIRAAANSTLAALGLAPLSLVEITSFIGNGFPHLVRLVMAARGIPTQKEDIIQARMFEHYMAHPATFSRPYPGVLECLHTLHSRGYSLGLCTNKPYAPAIEILEALKLSPIFDVVIGGDTLDVKKPHPAPLLAAIRELDTEALLFVGDSEVDAATAEAAKVPFALFTEGYRKTAVHELRHSVRFDRFGELADIVAQRDTAD
jgi:phosphoglycolate phosphatase